MPPAPVSGEASWKVEVLLVRVASSLFVGSVRVHVFLSFFVK